MIRLATFIGLGFGTLLLSCCETPEMSSIDKQEAQVSSEQIAKADSTAFTCYFPVACWSIEPLQPISKRPALKGQLPVAGKIFVALYPDAAREKVSRWRIWAARLKHKNLGKEHSTSYFAEDNQPLPQDLQALTPKIDEYLAKFHFRITPSKEMDCYDPGYFIIPILIQ